MFTTWKTSTILRHLCNNNYLFIGKVDMASSTNWESTNWGTIILMQGGKHWLIWLGDNWHCHVQWGIYMACQSSSHRRYCPVDSHALTECQFRPISEDVSPHRLPCIYRAAMSSRSESHKSWSYVSCSTTMKATAANSSTAATSTYVQNVTFNRCNLTAQDPAQH